MSKESSVDPSLTAKTSISSPNNSRFKESMVLSIVLAEL